MEKQPHEAEKVHRLQEESEKRAATILERLGLTWKDLEDQRVLDIGANIADFARAARTRSITIICVDNKPTGGWWDLEPWMEQGIGAERFHCIQQEQRDKYPHPRVAFDGIPYIQAEARALPFANDTFDVVLAHASIPSPTSDAQEELREAVRVLKPGGQFRFGAGGNGALRAFAPNTFNAQGQLMPPQISDLPTVLANLRALFSHVRYDYTPHLDSFRYTLEK